MGTPGHKEISRRPGRQHIKSENVVVGARIAFPVVHDLATSKAHNIIDIQRYIELLETQNKCIPYTQYAYAGTPHTTILNSEGFRSTQLLVALTTTLTRGSWSNISYVLLYCGDCSLHQRSASLADISDRITPSATLVPSILNWQWSIP
jgi:hypothetical protein